MHAARSADQAARPAADPAHRAGRAAAAAVVVGAAGDLGRHVCAALLAAGWQVTAVVRSVADPPPDCRLLQLDVIGAEPGELASALSAASPVNQEPALVVNAAGALWGVTDEQMVTGNVILVDRLVRAVQTLPGAVRLVHLGSAYEYGGHPGLERLPESLAPTPAGQYAQTKLAGTRLVTRAVAEGRIDATVLRISLSVGPAAPAQSLFGSLVRQLAARPEALTLPPVAGVRDVVDVRDVADAVLHAARAERVPPVVNIGAGVGVRLAEAVDTLIRIAGSTAAITRSPAPAARRDAAAGDQPLDITLARQALRWAPVRTLPETLQALWDGVPRPSFAAHSTITANGESTHG